jgi:type I restriction enzyme S subunit
MTFNQSCYGILPNEKINNEYLYYLLKQKVIELQGLSYGSVFDTITTKTFDGLDVKIPENLPEQQSIASILSAIDDKIENNLAINKTLEEMAMALYKHWFVDFGPFQNGEFVESELGLIPKGWEVKSVYDVSDVIYGAPFKSISFNEKAIGFPLIRIRDLKTLKPQYYTEENHPNKTVIKAGDVIAGMDAEFDPFFWLGEDGVLNQRLVNFKPKNGYSKMFIYHSVLPWLKFYAGAKVGTTVIHLGKSDIDYFKIKAPNDLNIVEEFNVQADNFLEQIVNNSKENQTLTQLRDTLLPKLISGEVRLKEFRESE